MTMSRIDTEAVIDREVKSRWAKWQPTRTELADWVFWMCKFPDDVVTNAVREHKTSSVNIAPKLKAVLNLCRKQAPKTEKVVCEFEPHTFVICVVGRTPGHYVPVIFPNSHRREYDEREYLGAAHRWQETLGSGMEEIWEVRRESTPAMINSERRQIQQEAALLAADTVAQEHRAVGGDVAAAPAPEAAQESLPF